MLFLRNIGALTSPIALTTGTTVVPFDTVVANTNDKTQFNASSNTISMPSPGWFATHIAVTVESTAANVIDVTLLANGTAVTGDAATTTLAAGDAETVILDVPVLVQLQGSAVAVLSWAITATAAATLTNVSAQIKSIT